MLGSNVYAAIILASVLDIIVAAKCTAKNENKEAVNVVKRIFNLIWIIKECASNRMF